jgi:nicotinic acid mononucleotide adenylyltransferase
MGVYSQYITRMDSGSEGDLIQQTDGHIKAFFTYGRFQPPTSGHAFLVNTVAEHAAAEESRGGADGYIFVSSSKSKPTKATKEVAEAERRGHAIDQATVKDFVGKMENPLDVGVKVKTLKKAHSNVNVKFVNTSICKSQIPDGVFDEEACRMVPQCVRKLYSSGYTDITMIVGQDRVKDFSKFIPPEVKVIGVGVVRTDKSISGTVMRTAAFNKDFTGFYTGVQSPNLTMDDIKALFNDVRVGMGLLPVNEDTLQKMAETTSTLAEGGRRKNAYKRTHKKRRNHKRTHKKRK